MADDEKRKKKTFASGKARFFGVSSNKSLVMQEVAGC